MTIRIASTVAKSKLADESGKRPWFASTAAEDLDAAPADRYVLGTFGYAPTFADALALAAQQRQSLDDELMEEVHASRSSRRAEQCGACRDQTGEHTYQDNCKQPATDLAELVRGLALKMNAHYATSDIHTVEATA